MGIKRDLKVMYNNLTESIANPIFEYVNIKFKWYDSQFTKVDQLDQVIKAHTVIPHYTKDFLDQLAIRVAALENQILEDKVKVMAKELVEKNDTSAIWDDDDCA